MALKKATSNCGTCDREVREDEISIKCDGNCERWHHKDCTGMTTGEFDIIKRKNSKLLWLCEKCKHKIKTPTSEEEEDKKEMKQAITENKKSCDEIKEQLEEMGNTLMTKMALILEAQLQQADYLRSSRKDHNHGRAVWPQLGTNQENTLSNDEKETGSRNNPGHEETSKAELQQTTRDHRHMENGHTTTGGTAGRRNANTIIRGTRLMEESSLQSGETWLFVGGLHHNTQEDALINYIKRNGVEGEIQCERLDTRGRNRAFKVGIPLSYISSVKTPDFWPQGVTVKRYSFRRPWSTGVEL